MDLEFYIIVSLWLVTLCQCHEENATTNKTKRHLMSTFFDRDSASDADSLINNRHSISGFFHRKFFDNNHHHDEEGPLRLSIPEPIIDHHNHYVVVKKQKPKIVEEIHIGPVIKTVQYFREPHGYKYIPTHITSSDIRKSIIVDKKGVDYSHSIKHDSHEEHEHGEDHLPSPQKNVIFSNYKAKGDSHHKQEVIIHKPAINHHSHHKKPTKFSDPLASFSQRVETVHQRMPNRNFKSSQFRQLPHFDSTYTFRDRSSQNFRFNNNNNQRGSPVSPRLPHHQRNQHFSRATFQQPSQFSNFGQVDQQFFSQNPPVHSNSPPDRPTSRLPNTQRNVKFSNLGSSNNEQHNHNSLFGNLAQLPINLNSQSNFGGAAEQFSHQKNFNRPSQHSQVSSTQVPDFNSNSNFNGNDQFSNFGKASSVPTARLPNVQRNSKFSNHPTSNGFERFQNSQFSNFENAQQKNDFSNFGGATEQSSHQNNFNKPSQHSQVSSIQVPDFNSNSNFNGNDQFSNFGKASSVPTARLPNVQRNSKFSNHPTSSGFERFQNSQFSSFENAQKNNDFSKFGTRTTTNENLQHNSNFQNPGTSKGNNKHGFSDLPHFEKNQKFSNFNDDFQIKTTPPSTASFDDRNGNSFFNSDVFLAMPHFVRFEKFSQREAPQPSFNPTPSTQNFAAANSGQSSKVNFNSGSAGTLNSKKQSSFNALPHFERDGPAFIRGTTEASNTPQKEENAAFLPKRQPPFLFNHRITPFATIQNSAPKQQPTVSRGSFTRGNGRNNAFSIPEDNNDDSNAEKEEDAEEEEDGDSESNFRRKNTFRTQSLNIKPIMNQQILKKVSHFDTVEDGLGNQFSFKPNSKDQDILTAKNVHFVMFNGKKQLDENFQPKRDQIKSLESNEINSDDKQPNLDYDAMHEAIFSPKHTGGRRLPKFQPTNFQMGKFPDEITKSERKAQIKTISKKVLAKVIKNKVDNDDTRRKQHISTIKNNGNVLKPEHFSQFVENEKQGQEILTSFNSGFGERNPDSSVAEFPLDPHNIYDKSNRFLIDSYGENINA